MGEGKEAERACPQKGSGKENVPIMSDVDNPSHYTQGGIECIDAIRAALTDEEFRGYCKGNMLKYVWRERHKGGDQDLAKAVTYERFLKEKG
jgi:hypothetical protein